MQSIDDETNEEMWPTLNEAHQGVVDNPMMDGWEPIVSPTKEAIEIKVLPPELRKLRHCASSPDLRFIGKSLAAVEEDDDDEDFSFVSEAESSDVSSAVMVDAASTSSRTVRRIPSFRDAVLLKTSNEQMQAPSSAGQACPKKVKPKIVVTPIKRCARSTGDLRSLVIHEEVLGESDAMDYYHRKAQGASGRMNSLKLRPDEAKRKQFTLQKKKMQRESQAATDQEKA